MSPLSWDKWVMIASIAVTCILALWALADWVVSGRKPPPHFWDDDER